MNEAILVTIKKMLGLDEDDHSFDDDILIHLNGTLLILHQVGISTVESFDTIDTGLTWADCFGEDISRTTLNAVKNYMYMKVRKGFDPPQSGTTMESLDALIREYEWRLNVSVDPAE